MEIDLSCAIFLKRILFEDLKNNVPRCLTSKYTNTNTQIHKYTNTVWAKIINNNIIIIIQLQKQIPELCSKQLLFFWFDIHNNMFPNIVKKVFLKKIEKCKCYKPSSSDHQQQHHHPLVEQWTELTFAKKIIGGVYFFVLFRNFYGWEKTHRAI